MSDRPALRERLLARQAEQQLVVHLAYGMNICPSAEIGEKAGKGRLLGWRLDFADSLATVTKVGGDEYVPVGLYQITPEELRRVDAREGVAWPGNPKEGLYRRLTVGNDDGLQIDEWRSELEPDAAEVYQKVERDDPTSGRYHGHAPSAHYLQMIREGYEAFGFDQGVLLRAVERSL